MYLYEQVAQFVGQHPNGVGRSEVGRAFGIAPTTAIYHLEKCVSRGLITRVFTWVQHGKRGWVYYPAAPMGLTLEEEQEWMEDNTNG